MNPENRRAKVSKWRTAFKRIGLAIGVIIAGAVLALMAGCATRGGSGLAETGQPPESRRDSGYLVPPPPPQHPHPSESILLGPFMPQASIMESAGDPVAVPSRSVTIRANPSLGATYYVLFAAPVPFLSAMQPAGTNATPEFTRATDQPMQFFQMRAGNEYGLSGWATK